MEPNAVNTTTAAANPLEDILDTVWRCERRYPTTAERYSDEWWSALLAVTPYIKREPRS